MKKTLKLLSLCFVAVALSMNFAACGDGEDDDNHGNTPGGTTGNRYAMSASGRNIKTITLLSQLNISFVYDAQGRVVQDNFELEGDVFSTSYEYGDGIITTTSSEGGEVYGTRTLTLTDGLITSIVGEYDGEAASMTFQYDGRKLVSYNYSDGYETYTLTWSDDNIVSSPSVFSGGEVNVPHTYNSDLISNDRLEMIFCTLIEEYGLLLQGYYGDGTKNRLSSTTLDMDGTPAEMSYSYTFDANNEVSTIDLSIMGYPLGMPTTVVWED